MKRILYIIAFFGTLNLNSQADPNFRQNNFNALLLNPAQAGANPYNDVTILGSQSWLGFEGAPRTLTASGNFNLKHNMGFGMSGFIDQIGPIRSSRVASDLAYHLKLNNEWRASVGLRAMISSTYVDLPSLSTTQANDPSMMVGLTSGTLFNMGFGGLVYSEQYYFGISMPRVASTSFSNVIMEDFVDRRGLILYGGAEFEIADSLKIRPSMLLRYVTSYPPLVDINAMFTYKNKYDFGLNYQVMNSIGLVLGYDLGNQLMIGYSYSFPTSKLNRVSFQSHEIVLRLKMPDRMSGATGGNFQSARFFN